MISSGYKKIKWGVLLSGLHIIIPIGIGYIQMIPAVFGYLVLFAGISELVDKCKLDYMEKIKKDTIRLIIFSIFTWVFGFLFSYDIALTKAIMALFYLFELLLYSDILNKTVKYYKENDMLHEADQLRKNRMKFIKLFLGIVLLQIIYMIPTDIASKVSGLILPVIEVAVTTLMIVMKVWFTIFIQRLTWEK